MIRWIIIILAIYILYRLFANDIKKKLSKEQSQEATEQKIASGEMVKDPECGTYIDKESTITVRNGEIIHRFCSYECRDAFLEKVKNGGRVLEDTTEHDD